jgi:hypothetical protein
MSKTTMMDAADPVRDAGPAKTDADEYRLWVLSGVAAVVLLASLAYGIAVAVTASPPEAPTAVASPSETPDWPAGDIRSLLANRPVGATAVESLGAADHTLSADQAAAIYGGAATSLAYLTNLGYLRGAATAWRAESPRYDVRISLLQFGSATQATTWVSDVQRSLGSGSEFESAAPLANIPGGVWFLTKHTPDAAFRVVHAVFGQGAIGVHMTFWCYPSAMPAVVTAVAADQYAKLPAG